VESRSFVKQKNFYTEEKNNGFEQFHNVVQVVPAFVFCFVLEMSAGKKEIKEA
jgi:hypothetical protein